MGDNFNNNKIRIITMGSNVIRNIVSKRTLEVEIDNSLLWLSPVSMMSKGSSNISSEKKPLHFDLDKTALKQYVYNHSSDWVLIDMNSIFYPIVEIEGVLFTYNQLFQSEVSADLIDEMKICTDISTIAWRTYIEEFAFFLKENFGTKIILIRAELKNSYIDGKHIEVMHGSNIEKNLILKEAEKIVIDKCDPYVIDSIYYHFLDRQSVFPKSSTTYDTFFNDEVVSVIYEIVNGSQQKIFSGNKEEFLLWVLIKCNQSIRANNLYKFILPQDNVVSKYLPFFGTEVLVEYQSLWIELLKKKYSLPEELTKDKLVHGTYIEELITLIDSILTFNTVCSCDFDKLYDGTLFMDKEIGVFIDNVLSRIDYKLPFQYKSLEKEKKHLMFNLVMALGNSQYQNAFQNLMNLQMMGKRTTKIDIWGSCISRQGFNSMYTSQNEKFEIVQYFYRNCFLFEFDKPIPYDENWFADFTDFKKSEWHRRNTLNALQRKSHQLLNKNHGDWLIVDFYDFCETALKIDNQYFVCEKTMPFFQKMGNKYEKTAILDLPYDYLKQKMDIFINYVYKMYGSHIILVKCQFNNTYIDSMGKLQQFNKNRKDLMKIRTEVANWEEYFCKKTGCYIIDIAKYFYSDAGYPNGGAYMVHYEPEYYTNLVYNVCEIIDGYLYGRYTEHLVSRLLIDRIIKYKKNGYSNNEIQLKIPNTYVMSYIISLSVETMIKYKSVLTEIVNSNFNYVDLYNVIENYEELRGCLINYECTK